MDGKDTRIPRVRFQIVSTPALAAAVLAGVVLALAACDRRVEPYIPLDEEPAPIARPLRVPGFENPVPRPPTRSSAAPGPPTQASGPAIRGTLRLADGVAEPGGGVLFVIARSGAGGPPLAVLRLAPGPFPMDFAIGPEHVMIPGGAFEGPITLTARVDLDGDPTSRDPDDLNAAAPSPLQPGATGVDLVLMK